MHLQKNWKEFMISTFLEMLPSPVHISYFGGYTLSTAVANTVCRERERIIVHVNFNLISLTLSARHPLNFKIPRAGIF